MRDETLSPTSSHNGDSSLHVGPDFPGTGTGNQSAGDQISLPEDIPAIASSPFTTSSQSHARWHSSFSSPDTAYRGLVGAYDSPRQVLSANNQKQVQISEADSSLFHYYLTQAGVWVRPGPSLEKRGLLNNK